MIDLGDFLTMAAGKRRVSGVWDCCTLPAEWAIANGWPDPMAHWRGAYFTEEEGRQFIADAGGLAALFDVGMSSAGIPAAGELTPGVIGVLQVGDEEAGSIFTGKRWALVAERGMAFASAELSAVTRMWSVARG